MCHSCKILRPPRSFHCAICDCCIEIHDHHCPWLGTCIGHRNFKSFMHFIQLLYFLAFFAFFPSLFTFLELFDIEKKTKFEEIRYVSSMSLIAFLGGFLLVFIYFICYEYFLILRNTTGNEYIRNKWNGAIN